MTAPGLQSAGSERRSGGALRRALANGTSWRLPPRGHGPARLTVCTIFKDEAPYLAEWVTFHRLMGVEEFYLYDNASTDDWRRVLAPELESGTVRVTPWTAPRERAQLTAYAHCLRERRRDPIWIAFIDVDEFLFSPTGRALPEIMSRFDRHPGVIAAWRVYGTGDWTERPDGLVTESYLLRGGEDHWLSAYGKPIVDPRRTVPTVSSPHCFAHYHHRKPWRRELPVDEGGRAFSGECGTADVLRINHYYSKSVAEATAKRRRGSVTHTAATQTPLEQFLDVRLNAVRDDAIVRFVPDLRRDLTVRARASN